MESKILRICPGCKTGAYVRKRNMAMHCRSCRPNKKIGKQVDLAGLRRGKLLAIEKDYSRKVRRSYYWKCLCDCGNYTLVQTGRFNAGKTHSCGCLKSSKGNMSETKI